MLVELAAATYVFAISDPNDVAVWQGQYFIGNKFQTGTFEFKFDVYDAPSGGNRCYSNTTNLTTGNWGEWVTEQPGISAACSNAAIAYYLEITINGVKQFPRRRLTVLHFLRSDVAESTDGSIKASYLKATFGVKELNKDIWKLKMDYAADLADETIAAQEVLALAHIASAKATSDITVGESLELKRERLIAAGTLAQNEIIANAKIAKAKILEARETIKLNGETPEDAVYIENEAQSKANALDVLAAEKAEVIDQALDAALDSLIDDGKRFCLSDGTNCLTGGGVWGSITGTLGDQTDLATALSGKETLIAPGTSSQYWRGDKTFQTLDKAAVGLGNVENIALSSWVGTSNISALGTITSGTWQATAIGLTKGGTGLTSGGSANQLFGMNSAGTGLEYKTLTAGSNISVSHGVGSATVGVVANPAFDNVNLNTLRINRGEAITGFFSVSPANVVSESIGSRTCGNYAKIEVRGARPGNTVSATPRPDVNGIENVNLSWNAYVSDVDTVVIRACNPAARAIDTADRQTWVVDVWAP